MVGTLPEGDISEGGLVDEPTESIAEIFGNGCWETCGSEVGWPDWSRWTPANWLMNCANSPIA